MITIDEILRARLTAAQYQAATDPTPEILTLACAGSGKSTTLAFRIARLVVLERNPQSIVAFTFTEKAADAIKFRVAQALRAVGEPDTTVGAIYIGTIHAYCQYVLSIMDARYRQFEVLDENRLKLFLVSRFPQVGLQRLRAARAAPNPPRYFETIRKVAEAWTSINEELIEIDDVIAGDQALGEVLRNLRALLDRDQFIDFSSMERLVVEALDGANAQAWQAIENLGHLMVDEYQDVNPVQEQLIRLLRRQVRTLFVVGDDDQSIFSWRGADVHNILSFQERYPNSAQHTLSQNFRSTEAIVRSADGFAAAELGANRIPKNPTAQPVTGPRDFRRLWFGDRQREADWVADRIASLLGTRYGERDGSVRGLTPSDFAILMRSTRRPEQAGPPRHAAFTDALTRRGIDYTLEAGGAVFDRQQVHVLRETLELLRHGSPSRNEAQPLFQNLILPTYPQADRTRFFAVLAEWGRLIHGPTEGTRRRVYPQRLVHELLEAFGIARTPFDAGTMQDLGVFSRIIQDVETVYLSIDTTERFREILNFLQNVAEAGYNTATEDIFRQPNTVTVSTVHKAKGLEFPAVFIADVEAQRFPTPRSSYDGWLPLQTMRAAINRGAYQGTVEDEARLFYTALTRAERYLHVSGAERLPGGTRRRRPSPFSMRLADDELSTDPMTLPVGLTPHPPARRMEETIVPTSYSEIRYYLRCPADYRFRKTYGFSPPITDLFGYGRSIHAAVGKLHELFPAVAPSPAEAEGIGRRIFHVKHVPRSSDPVNRPGAYERAQDSAAKIVREYATTYGEDFTHRRQLEVRFEVPVRQAVISGAIDLLLHYDPGGNIVDARVVDFKAVDGGEDPEQNERLHWTELALQVQLYAKAAREVLGQNARTGAVHLLKNNRRIDIPVGDDAVAAAIANVEWAIDRVIASDFPMRPRPDKCAACDFQRLCPKVRQEFSAADLPPPIHVPGGAPQPARLFAEVA